MFGSYVKISTLLLLAVVDEVELGLTKKQHLMARQDVPDTSKPVIGVLAQETSGRINKHAQGQYVLGTYVNLLESVGARVVPILVNQTAEEIEAIFNAVNGILIPGGHVKLQYSMYGRVGKQLYDLALKANDRGDFFPVWAECLGLELIALMASARGFGIEQLRSKILEDVDARDLYLPLTLVGDWKNSKIFGDAPTDMIKFMTTNLKGYHNHNKAVTMKTFKKYKKFANMFNVLSINKDRKGKEYISTMEGKKYPFWLLHWQPSKASVMIPDGYNDKDYKDAMANAKYLYSVFIDAARKNKHKFVNTGKLARNLINQYPLLLPLKNENVETLNLRKR